MSMPSTKHRSSVVRLVILLICTALCATLVINKQIIIDYVRGSQYTPSSAMQAIRSELGLTDRGEFYFNASQPTIEPPSKFNQSCRQTTETNNPILGCYDMQRIYIFDVTNQKLAGIEQTTAAHELLHAVYERLSSGDKATLNSELEKAYQSNKSADIEARMNYYKASEPGEEMNELHSMLGTEIENLGPKLEAHYRQYFTNRAAIVAFHSQYDNVFRSVTGQMKSLNEAINTGTSVLNTRIDEYNKAAKQLEADANDFKRRNQNNQITSLGQFNAEQNALLERQDLLAAEKQSIVDTTADLNTKRAQYNQLVGEYNQLSVSINSNLTPVNTLQ